MAVNNSSMRFRLGMNLDSTGTLQVRLPAYVSVICTVDAIQELRVDLLSLSMRRDL